MFGFVAIAVKKTPAAKKDEQLEKKQELERRLQDVTGALGNAKKPKKGKGNKSTGMFLLLLNLVIF